MEGLILIMNLKIILLLGILRGFSSVLITGILDLNKDLPLAEQKSFIRLFDDYVKSNEKDYSNDDEYKFRFKIFEKNVLNLFGDLNNIKDRYLIVEKNLEGKKRNIIVVNGMNPCDQSLSLNTFADLTDVEFRKGHLLPAQFFDEENYPAKSKIFEPEENFKGKSFHGHTDWLSGKVGQVVNDPEYDIFYETLKKRQDGGEERPVNSDPKSGTYEQQFISEIRQFTKHDIAKADSDVKGFVFDSLPDYSSKIREEEVEDDDVKKCRNYLRIINRQGELKDIDISGHPYLQDDAFGYDEEQEGRRLQYYSNYNSLFGGFGDNSYSNNNYNYSSPSYNNYNYSSPSYNNYSSPSYNNYNYSSPSYNNYSSPSYNNYNYSSPSYNNYNYSSPSYSNNYSRNFNNYSDSNNNLYNSGSYSNNNYSSNGQNYYNNLFGLANYSQPQTYSNNQYGTSSYQQPSYTTTSTNNRRRRKKKKRSRRRRTTTTPSYSSNDYTNYTTSSNNNYQSSSYSTASKGTNKKEITVGGVKIPTYLNWAQKRSLSQVKDQGDCNACYAFGALSGLEAHNILKNNNHNTYSEQEILDCSSKNLACVGGQPYLVYDYIKRHGVHLQSDYPYRAKKSSCKRKSGNKFRGVKGYIFTKKGLMNLLVSANFGPVVVVSYASDHLKYYYSGIFKGQGCTEFEKPNHSSLLYGYNLNAPEPYLMFKNNWGTAWGNSGHYKVAIGDLNSSNMGKCLLANTPYNVIPLL